MDITKCIEASSIEEEAIKCVIKRHVETVNEEIKGSSIEEEDIEIRKCRRRSRVEIMNEEVKGYTFS